ncbi:MAG: tRNA preQ1(34) S-adenosylmethionine ribosyltransferase-isomerase QueA [Deltaproteobacteria bacterium]|nr:tRNA preQ1(34) S-adenosylmethionine ribosyltransferase-isomerase QueA [Deltaproteobacteria bacterium]
MILPAETTACPDRDPLAEFVYDLPRERIAQAPAPRRVQARLMVLPLTGGAPRHERVAGLGRLLAPGDLLVVNDTQVVPARLPARRENGGRAEVFLLNPAHPRELLPGGGERHAVLIRPSRRLSPGAELWLRGGVRVRVHSLGERGQALVDLDQPALALAAAAGEMPLPPYIKRPWGPTPDDCARYQTVYAARQGAVAAPTAGLHLSPELLAALAKRGVGLTRVTLHVGYGTFAEPAPEDLASGRLHAEWVEVPEEAARAVARTREAGGRVVAVGTTSARALEWRAGAGRLPRPGSGWCDLLIRPGHEFGVVDGLLTNFHLPKSTLLMLVSALAGRERVLDAYREAVRRSYRFYSFGDAMLLI